MIVKTNMDAMRAFYTKQKTLRSLANSEKKLSSGAKFSTALDDPGQYALYRRANIDIKGLQVGIGNLEDGLKPLEVLDEALSEGDEILSNIRSLVLQARNSTYSSSERSDMLKEIRSLSVQYAEVLNNAQYNGRNLLAHSNISINGVCSEEMAIWDLGEYANDSEAVLVIQHGFELGATDNQFVFDGADTTTLSVAGGATDATSVSGYWSAGKLLVMPFVSEGPADTAMASQFVSNLSDGKMLSAAYSHIETAISGMAYFRSDVSRIHATISKKLDQRNLELQNMQAYQSRLHDVDAAQEIIKYTSNQILAQTGNAMLAQANTRSQQVLDLLR